MINHLHLLCNRLKTSQPHLLLRLLYFHPFSLSSSNHQSSFQHPDSSQFVKPYSSSSLHPNLSHYRIDHTHYQFEQEEDGIDDIWKNPSDENTHLFIKILRQANQFTSDEQSMGFLYKSGAKLKPTESLICSVIWELRNEWELGFLAFKWGVRNNNCDKAWILMISVLCKHSQFGVAWSLIRKMVRSSIDSPRKALLIMITSYAAASKPDKAVRTFQAMEKFGITADSEAFHTLLRALCKYGDVELAEEFMLTNKKSFPLEIESFNIILDGWSNISLDEVEAKRIWREMSNYCITPNSVSYTHMISCFSKVGNLFDSLRLYDEMKKRGWFPGHSVYNSLIYVLTRENCLKDALNLFEKIKEVGLKADSTTYNSFIIPLCEGNKLDEAHVVLDDMIREGLIPTTATFHAFVKEERSLIGTTELLRQMKETGCGPDGNTFLLIFNKFFKFLQSENVLKMWAEMKRLEVMPDSAHYNVVVVGLAKFGWMKKAREIYDEMKTLGFAEDPKLKKLFQGTSEK